MGDMLDKMELFLIMTSLLQRFNFEKEHPGLRHSLESVVDQLTTAPLPYKTRVVKRENWWLYSCIYSFNSKKNYDKENTWCQRQILKINTYQWLVYDNNVTRKNIRRELASTQRHIWVHVLYLLVTTI